MILANSNMQFLLIDGPFHFGHQVSAAFVASEAQTDWRTAEQPGTVSHRTIWRMGCTSAPATLAAGTARPRWDCPWTLLWLMAWMRWICYRGNFLYDCWARWEDCMAIRVSCSDAQQLWYIEKAAYNFVCCSSGTGLWKYFINPGTKTSDTGRVLSHRVSEVVDFAISSLSQCGKIYLCRKTSESNLCVAYPYRDAHGQHQIIDPLFVVRNWRQQKSRATVDILTWRWQRN